MAFLRVNVTFNNAVNVIHDVSMAGDPYQYTSKFVFLSARKKQNKN